MKFLIAEKLDMTGLFNESGDMVATTRVKVLPAVVSQIKTKDNDGYDAVQISCGNKSHSAKATKGHLAKLTSFFKKAAPKYVREFKATPNSCKVGDILDAGIFSDGEAVSVRGISKGKGFAGVVKRHHFKGSPASHGHKDQLRMPGSIGSKEGGPVAKGKRMGGRMGGERLIIRGLEILKIEPEANILYIKGGMPGAYGSYLEIFSERAEIGDLKNYLDDGAKSQSEDNIEEIYVEESIDNTEKKDEIQTPSEKIEENE